MSEATPGFTRSSPARSLTVLVVAALVASVLIVQAAPASAAAGSSEFEDCLLDEINAARAAAGVAALDIAPAEAADVREFSEWMSDNEFRHMTAKERDAILPVNTTAWAENVGWSSVSTYPDCTAVHELFMDSPAHRANLLNASVRFLAPGVHIDASGTWVTELFFAAPGYVPAFEGTFFDDDDSVFENDIEKLVVAGITYGCGDGRYCPNAFVNRGQMAAFLVRALDLPAAPSAGFTDTTSSVFATQIDSLAAAGVTRGCGGERYCPGRVVTRAQMAAFLVRALGLPAAPSAGFTDTATSIFAADIDSLAAAGITMGCGGGRFCPSSPVTRGQMAAFLVRALDL